MTSLKAFEVRAKVYLQRFEASLSPVETCHRRPEASEIRIGARKNITLAAYVVQKSSFERVHFEDVFESVRGACKSIFAKG